MRRRLANTYGNGDSNCNCNSHTNSYGYGYSYGDGDSYTNADCNANSYAYTDPAGYSYSKTAHNAEASAVASIRTVKAGTRETNSRVPRLRAAAFAVRVRHSRLRLGYGGQAREREPAAATVPHASLWSRDYRIPLSHSHCTLVIFAATTSTSNGPKRPMLLFLPFMETL